MQEEGTMRRGKRAISSLACCFDPAERRWFQHKDPRLALPGPKHRPFKAKGGTERPGLGTPPGLAWLSFAGAWVFFIGARLFLRKRVRCSFGSKMPRATPPVPIAKLSVPSTGPEDPRSILHSASHGSFSSELGAFSPERDSFPVEHAPHTPDSPTCIPAHASRISRPLTCGGLSCSRCKHGVDASGLRAAASADWRVAARVAHHPTHESARAGAGGGHLCPAPELRRNGEGARQPRLDRPAGGCVRHATARAQHAAPVVDHGPRLTHWCSAVAICGRSCASRRASRSKAWDTSAGTVSPAGTSAAGWTPIFRG